MDKELKEKWVAALRGGEIEQGEGKLLDSNSGAMCCVGVLARICGLSDDALLAHNSSLYSGPLSVTIRAGVDEKTLHKLAEMNDGYPRPHSFNAIADYIERNL